MKTLKDLRIKVTYTVSYDVEVSDDVYDAIQNAYTKGVIIPTPDECLGDDELSKVSEWLYYNTQERDAIKCEFEIEDIVD